MSFSGKIVFVTGASRGIGQAIAKAFFTQGARVIGTCTNESSERGVFCHEWVIADFCDSEQIQFCVDAVRRLEPDVLVNNAGINKNTSFVDIDPSDFLAIQQVNVFAPFLLCQTVIPSMIKKKWGRIVNVSSIWGKISKEYRASYSASKFAIDGMTLALSAEYSEQGILANCIAPGFIDTELTRRMLSETEIQTLTSKVPVRRLGDVDEVSRLVIWLASKENTFITGQNIAIDGGFTRV